MAENLDKCPVCGTEAKNGRCPSCGMPLSSAELATERKEHRRLAQQFYDSAVQCVLNAGCASTSLLQRRLHIGYAVAATIMDMMEENGVVGPYCGAQPREVLLPLQNESPSFQDSFDVPIQSFPAEQTSSQSRLQSPVRAVSPLRSSTHRPTVRLTMSDLDRMEGHDFEYACADILSANGYSDVQVTQASGDYGIDVLASKNGNLYAIQCKCYQSAVGNHAVQEAYAGAAYYGGRIPVVMTNQNFTSAATNMAQNLGVQLWGRNELSHLLAAYNNQKSMPIHQRLLFFLVKGLIGSPSSVAATLLCILGLFNAIQTDGTQDFPTTILSCVICWFLFKRLFVWLGKKLLK